MESKLGNSRTKHQLKSHIYAHTQSTIDKIWQILISEGQQTFVKRKKALLIVQQQQQQRVWNTSIYWNYFKWLGQREYFVISLVTAGCWKTQCDYQWVYLHRKRPCIFPQWCECFIVSPCIYSSTALMNVFGCWQVYKSIVQMNVWLIVPFMYINWMFVRASIGLQPGSVRLKPLTAPNLSELFFGV